MPAIGIRRRKLAGVGVWEDADEVLARSVFFQIDAQFYLLESYFDSKDLSVFPSAFFQATLPLAVPP